MPPKKTTKKTKKKPRIEDEISDNLQEDDEMFNAENAALGAANEQEDLTQEQKDEVILKTLTTMNPQAPSNITVFSFAERRFMKEDSVNQIVFHYEVDGDIIMKDTDAANQQDDDAEMKKKNETDMLYSIN